MNSIHPSAAPLSRSNETGLTDSTHSSSSSTSTSAERYRLLETDDRPILVYRYRGKLGTSSQKDLCAMLDKDESLRVTTKPIPRATSYLDVLRHDLYMPDEKPLYASFPNYDSNLASVKIPTLAYWARLLWGGYGDLYIVSPETSPRSSEADADSSRRTSPTSTWGHEDERHEVEAREESEQ